MALSLCLNVNDDFYWMQLLCGHLRSDPDRFYWFLSCESCSLTKHHSFSYTQTHALFIPQSYLTAMILISKKQFSTTRSRRTVIFVMILYCFWIALLQVCVFIWAAGQRSINVFSVRLVSAAFTPDQTIYTHQCLCVILLLLLLVVLMHYWQSVVSEYLAALMRCIFILLFYFPPNGSNEQLRPVWSGLIWFSDSQTSWREPKPCKTCRSQWLLLLSQYSWLSCSQTKELHGRSHGTDYPQSLWRHRTDDVVSRGLRVWSGFCGFVSVLLSSVQFRVSSQCSVQSFLDNDFSTLFSISCT